MNTVDTLLEQLAQNPDDDTLASACVDALFEQGPHTFENCQLVVANNRQHAREARTLAQATYLMRAGTPSAEYIRGVLSRGPRAVCSVNAPIYLFVGNQHPASSYHRQETPNSAWVEACATVGAQWVVDTWAEKQTRDARRKAQAGRSRRAV